MPFAINDGTKIYWAAEGAGDPLLLIMGLGATHEWWYRVSPVLARRFRTILFDNRGVGLSDVPPGPYSISQMAADAVAVLDAAGADAAHVFGASMGGMVAQEVALQYPRRVRSLILGCTACGGRDGVPARREVLDALGARATMTREEAMRVMVPYIFDADTPRDVVEADLAVRLKTNVPNEGYFAQLQAIRSWPGSLSRLGSLGTPTLVVHGETDELVPAENGRILARAIPNASLVMIPRASHIFFTDRFDASCAAIMRFLGEKVTT
jgi:pimeloyl-ACP methyl ester carboxylesterase